MTNTFTLKDDIIRFVYSETSTSENEVLMELLMTNDELYDFYMQCALTKENIDAVSFEPSEKSINNILNYSKSTVYSYQ